MFHSLFPVRSVRFALILLFLALRLSFLSSLAFVDIFGLCSPFLSRSFSHLLITAPRGRCCLEYRQSHYSETGRWALRIGTPGHEPYCLSILGKYAAIVPLANTRPIKGITVKGHAQCGHSISSIDPGDSFVLCYADTWQRSELQLCSWLAMEVPYDHPVSPPCIKEPSVSSQTPSPTLNAVFPFCISLTFPLLSRKTTTTTTS